MRVRPSHQVGVASTVSTTSAIAFRFSMTMPGCSLSVNGPMTRTVEDAALFLDVITGPAPGGFVAASRARPAADREFGLKLPTGRVGG